MTLAIVLTVIYTIGVWGLLVLLTDNWKYYTKGGKIKKLLVTVLMVLVWIASVSALVYETLSLIN